MPDRKINFCNKLTVKVFQATVVNADIDSLNFLHMLVKFEQNSMVQTTQNFELFAKKTGFFKAIFDKALTTF